MEDPAFISEVLFINEGGLESARENRIEGLDGGENS